MGVVIVAVSVTAAYVAIYRILYKDVCGLLRQFKWSMIWHPLLKCVFRSEFLIRQGLRQEEHSYTPAGSIGCGKERGWEERTSTVLIGLFNFVPRLPENLSHTHTHTHTLSLSLTLTLAMRMCSLYATWHKGNTGSRTVQDIGAQSDCSWGGDNEIFHQAHRSNLWNNKYCHASNVVLFRARIQKITMPTIIDFSPQGHHS